MKNLIKTIAGILLSLWVSVVAAQGHRSPSVELHIKQVENGLIDNMQVTGQPAVTYTLAQRMEFYKTPTVCIALINNGKLEWVKAYGVAGPNNEMAANPETLFQIASYSKGISDVLTMELVQEGVLKLDENVNTYLKNWKFPESEGPITVRDLVTGRSGIAIEGFFGYFKGEAVPALVQLLNGAKPANNPPVRSVRKPRGQAVESGGAYLVLQQLIEDVTGEPFDQVLKEKLTGPLGMKFTSGLQPAGENVANGYQRDGREIKSGWLVYPQLASSGLWSTAGDLARFIMERQKAINGQSKALKPGTVLQMIDPDAWKPGYVAMLPPADRLFDGLTSSNLGYMTYMEGSTQSGRGIVIMTNSNNGADLIREILNGIDKVYNWHEHQPNLMMQLSSAQLKAFEGKYQMGQDDKSYIQIAVRGNYLVATHFPDRATFKIYPKSELNFFSDTPGLGAKFFKDKDGKISKFIAFGRDEWVKVD